jgi:D-serine dehydratase
VDPLAEPLDGRFRAFPVDPALRVGDVGGLGWRLLDGHLRLPVLTLRRSALEHNLETMAGYCRDRGVWLAPHGKTTMAPQLVRRQLDAGAWGVTVASAAQAEIFAAAGVGQRILLANEVVDPASLAAVARLVLDGVDLTCLVDSVEAVAVLDAAMAAHGVASIPVLVEVGVAGGRAGARSLDAVQRVLDAVQAAPRLTVRGVECFEGVLSEPAAVDGFLATLVEAARLAANDAPAEVMVTAGGSLFFDRVVDAVQSGLGTAAQVVLRSGCYLTHDHGHYDRDSPWGSAGATPSLRLRPALELWSHVLSTPEPGLAIASFGKRDAAYDLDLPVPLRLLRGASDDGASNVGASDVDGGHALSVRALNDQHAFVDVPAGVDVAVGDVLVCGLSHPCTAFDKWSLIAEIDDDLAVVSAIRTYF